MGVNNSIVTIVANVNLVYILIYFDRHCLCRSLMLRRTKVGRGEELGLPPRIVYTRRDLFSPEEEDVYEALYSGTFLLA